MILRCKLNGYICNNHISFRALYNRKFQLHKEEIKIMSSRLLFLLLDYIAYNHIYIELSGIRSNIIYAMDKLFECFKCGSQSEEEMRADFELENL